MNIELYYTESDLYRTSIHPWTKGDRGDFVPVERTWFGPWSASCSAFTGVFVVVRGGQAEGGSKLGRAEEGDEGEGSEGRK